jgi:hypothetical protein
MKKLLSSFLVLLILGCSKSIPDEITPANNPIIQAYNKITEDDFVGSWVYYIERDDKSSAYKMIIINRVNAEFFIDAKSIMLSGDWIDDFQLPSQKLIDFVNYQQAESYKKQPNFSLIDAYRDKNKLYMKIEANRRYLEYRGDKYYKE